MKLYMPVVALFIALLPVANVGVADEKKEFLQSLEVPLSATEMARLDYLIKKEAEAEAISATAFRRTQAAEKALHAAAPSAKADLQKKAKAAELANNDAIDRLSRASRELSDFEWSKRRRRLLPAEVAKVTKPGAVTLVYEKLKTGTKGWPALLHISVVPKPLPSHTSRTKTTNVEIAAIEEGVFPNSGYGRSPNGETFTFRVDIFSASSDQPNAPYQLVNSTQYADISTVGRLELKYLKPKFKQGPMLFLRSNAYKSTDFRLLTFPDGLAGRLVTQHFPNYLSFGAPDKRGITVLENRREANPYSVSNDDSIIRHVWNGRGFVAQREILVTKPFMVIGALSKNRASLEKLRAQLSSSSAEVLPTSKYPRLPSGQYVLVLARLKTRQEADQWLKGNKEFLPVNKSGFKFEVRRAS